MLKRKCGVLFAIVLGVWLVAAAGAAGAPYKPVSLAQVTDTIAKVRTGDPVAVRARAAEQLYELTHGVNPLKIDDKTVAGMVSLLDTQDDPVRLWVAASLGNLGRRARVAIPKLTALLSTVECNGKSLPSAQAIRYALIRIGKPAPPPPCAPVKRDTTPSPKSVPPPPPLPH